MRYSEPLLGGGKRSHTDRQSRRFLMRDIRRTISKVAEHARQGTLLSRLWQEIRRGDVREGADPDHYRGEAAEHYLEERLQQKSWHIEQDIVRSMLSTFPDGATVLDVPFGTGRFVDMYLHKRMKVYGLDISQDMLNIARKTLGESYDQCRIQLGTAESLPYEDKFFDLVVCFRFFGLISFDMARKVLAEIHRVARDLVIIRVPVRMEGTQERSNPKGREAVQGNLLEGELISMFGEHGLHLRESRLIEERSMVRYVVYLLTKAPRSPTAVLR